MTKAAPPSPHRPGRAVLEGLLDLRPSVGVERTAVAADDAVARGLAIAKVYAFAASTVSRCPLQRFSPGRCLTQGERYAYGSGVACSAVRQARPANPEGWGTVA
jgi:hypothetical protein